VVLGPNGGRDDGSRASRRLRRALVGVLIGVLVVVDVTCLLLAGRITWVEVGSPATDRLVPGQVAFLRQALATGAGERMQGLFPEGFFFTHALTGLAAASTAGDGDPVAAQVVEQELAALDSDAGRAPFGTDLAPAHGAFWSGWSLLLAVELARLRPGVDPTTSVRSRAAPLVAAYAASPTGFLESYPGQRWPVDNVVAVAALARADRRVGVPGAADAVRTWTARSARARDPVTGLLPHRLDGDAGSVTSAEPARGTSASLITLFEPDIDAELGQRDYRAFVRRFVVRRLGWVATVEYGDAGDGPADVDSGPLVLGVSLSATVLTLGAARRSGDERLALELEREAELFGVPWQWDGRRRYAGGLLPVGDAFLAFARAVQPPGGGTGQPQTGAPDALWWLWAAGLALTGLAPWVTIAGRRLRVRHVESKSEGAEESHSPKMHSG
jgi:hypothetical protein